MTSIERPKQIGYSEVQWSWSYIGLPRLLGDNPGDLYLEKNDLLTEEFIEDSVLRRLRFYKRLPRKKIAGPVTLHTRLDIHGDGHFTVPNNKRWQVAEFDATAFFPDKHKGVYSDRWQVLEHKLKRAN